MTRKRELFSPSGNAKISAMAFEAALQRYPYAPRENDYAKHLPSGMRVGILQRGTESTLCLCPRGAQISFMNETLEAETFS